MHCGENERGGYTSEVVIRGEVEREEEALGPRRPPNLAIPYPYPLNLPLYTHAHLHAPTHACTPFNQPACLPHHAKQTLGA
ncbi:hypothetical protein Pcinc_041578 [Petrolisthes cinctipes]|uniref:Uncharacterized protein n=1 Tax=Petrolisthes cinctipes TaxID=88211 RepID=A0AAE1BM95_PETCI|nr:hypothetical protein Pcinc_041578 [Petrolisthes cinctipes]